MVNSLYREYRRWKITEKLDPDWLRLELKIHAHCMHTLLFIYLFFEKKITFFDKIRAKWHCWKFRYVYAQKFNVSLKCKAWLQYRVHCWISCNLRKKFADQNIKRIQTSLLKATIISEKVGSLSSTIAGRYLHACLVYYNSRQYHTFQQLVKIQRSKA